MENCKKCGTCCRKGGPALHAEDLELLKKGSLPVSSLVTIRKGEPVFSPISGKVEPAKVEFLKVSLPDSWKCPFLDQNDNTCNHYKDRPIECYLLKCWDTNEIEEVIYKDNLSRWDIIDSTNPLFSIIKTHNETCSYLEMGKLADEQTDISEDNANKIREIIARDLELREKAINQSNISLQEELFYFGRPMFKSLSYFGVK